MVLRGVVACEMVKFRLLNEWCRGALTAHMGALNPRFQPRRQLATPTIRGAS